MLINDNTSEALDMLTGAYFDLNRTFDRCVSVMKNKFAMPNAANIIHHRLAHLFPIMADKVTEIKDNYELDSVYPETHRDGRNYNNLEDMTKTMLDELIDCYKVLVMTNKVALECDDFNVHAWLIPLMNWHTQIFGQVSTLYDKAKQLSIQFDTYDNHIDKWGIIGIPELLGDTSVIATA